MVTSQEVEIRPVENRDIANITRLYGQNVKQGLASWEYEAPDEAEMTRRISALREAGFPYLVAELEGEFVGYSYASSYRPRPGYRFTVENSIYVRDDIHRRGVASALMGALIRACEAQGYRQMVAIIGDSGNIPSIRLHERMGFVEAGLLKNIGWKQGRWLDSVIMQRALGEGHHSEPEETRKA